MQNNWLAQLAEIEGILIKNVSSQKEAKSLLIERKTQKWGESS